MTVTEIRPSYLDGVPFCAEDECPSYDGKRCRLLGRQPDSICAPEVKRKLVQLQSLNDCIERMKDDALRAKAIGLDDFHNVLQACILKLQLARGVP